MAKKGQVFQQYTEEFKLAAVKAYVERSSSHKVMADNLNKESFNTRSKNTFS
jgi:transposase